MKVIDLGVVYCIMRSIMPPEKMTQILDNILGGYGEYEYTITRSAYVDQSWQGYCQETGVETELIFSNDDWQISSFFGWGGPLRDTYRLTFHLLNNDKNFEISILGSFIQFSDVQAETEAFYLVPEASHL